MEAVELRQILIGGENTTTQFKRIIRNPEQLASEMVAFSNSSGGKLIVGVEDSGLVVGLSSKEIHDLNLLISNVASEGVKPSINPVVDTVVLDEGTVLVLSIARGINKPYQDKNGIFWVKNGADKRKATAREEIQRIFQEADLLHGDEAIVHNAFVSDLDLAYFQSFVQKMYGKLFQQITIPLDQFLQNLSLGRSGKLNVTAVLLFAQFPSIKLPTFIVKAAVLPSTSIATDKYTDLRDITGKMSDIFQQTVNFVLSNIKHIQGDQGVNSVGQPEIPRAVLEELIANALVHRNYFISAPIRVLVFIDRVEIISPGHLHNDMTIDNLKAGISKIRNNVLASHTRHLLPYLGMGSGIVRAIQAYPYIDFINDREGNQFKCIIKRAN